MPMSEYIPTIGLEIHAELKTATKMFCNSRNDANEIRPNVNICPVCLAHPGTLPVVNRAAVHHVLRVGVALGAKLADYTEFDRKNYFYPDLPKGYQISQYEFPLISGGALSGVAITRVHLEEDTASSVHDEHTGVTKIDYNRAGVPLMELVTEPVIRSAEEASTFARELQLLLRYLGASDANMEKGEMRVEANVSVSNDPSKMGTKTEIKNLNSFRAMERAVACEIKRQTDLLKRGGAVVQETRGWDEAKQATFPQRVKEGSADYRYFPDPDIPSFRLSEVPGFSSEEIQEEIPELPWQRRERYIAMGVRVEDASSFVRDIPLGKFFDAVIEGDTDSGTVKLAANYVANDLVNVIRDTVGRDTEVHYEIPISARNFKKIIDMLADGRVSSRAGKDLLMMTISEGEDPESIAKRHDLYQKNDATQLEGIVDRVLENNSTVADDFRKGKAAALEYLLGQCMKELRGAGNPQVLRNMIRSKIG